MKKRICPRMAEQYHGYDSWASSIQIPVFYPWYCPAIRGALLLVSCSGYGSVRRVRVHRLLAVGCAAAYFGFGLRLKSTCRKLVMTHALRTNRRALLKTSAVAPAAPGFLPT